MLRYALISFVIAIIAANFGFGRSTVASQGIGQMLSMLFFIAFVMIINAGRRV